MAITDDLEGERRAVARAAVPGPQSPGSDRIAPKPAAGTAWGTALRTGVAGAMDQAASGVGSAIGTVTAPARGALGFARDSGRAVAGMPASPNAGRPVGMPSLRLPSFPRVAPKPSFSDVTSRVLPGPAAPARADFSDVSSRVVPGTTAAAETAGPPGRIQRAVDAAGNSVYSDSAAGLQQGVQLANAGFGTGGDRRVAASALDAGPATGVLRDTSTGDAQGLATAARPVASVGAPAQVVAPRPAPAQAVRGRQGAVIRNPNDTLVDRLTRAMGSASLKGSPSSRAAVAQAILGEEGAQRDERMQTLRTQDQADLAAQQANAVSAENAANRQMEAARVNAHMADNAAGRATSVEMARLARRPEVSVAADGGMGVINPDGSWRPVTGADGSQIRAPQAPRQTGELTDVDRLKSYTERYNAIVNGMGKEEEKASAVAALDADPLYAGLRGNQPPAPPAEAVTALRANPGASQQFDEVFGQGAAARYLGQ